MTPYRLRAVKVAIEATAITIAGLAVFGYLRRPLIPRPALYGLTLLLGFGGAAFMAALPWRRMFETRVGLRVMYLWSTLDIVLITMLVVALGKNHGEMFFIYALTTVFFAAAAYPLPVQGILMALTFGAYATGLMFVPGALDPAVMMLRLVLLACSGFMASYLSWELRSGMEAHGHSRGQAERRAELLQVVARASRAMSSLEPDHVLGVVADSVLEFGFNASSLCLVDDSRDSYRVVESRGVPAEYSGTHHRVSEGVVSRVLDQQSTITMDDYSNSPAALPVMRDRGFKSVIAAPIWIDGLIQAVLIGGSHEKLEVDPVEIEGFNLLTAQAARAFENAKRFAEEKRTVERLAELDRLKSDFLSNMSHEMRTPLTAIEGMTITMLARWNSLDDDDRLDLLRRVNANSHSLDSIISNLLDFARFDAGRIQLNRERFDVSRMAHQIPLRLAQLDDYDIEVKVEPNLCAVGDPEMIERVLENLLSNSGKHNPIGTPIWIRAFEEEGKVAISVGDSGRGIPPEEIVHIGERFFRGGDLNTRGTRGVGLGLAFAKQIVELHGEALKVESELGVGTVFSFSLPLASEHLETTELHASA